MSAGAGAFVGAATVRRGSSALARAFLAVGVLAAAAAADTAAAPASAAPAVLYAAAAAAGSGDCSVAADACTLTTALKDVARGGVIELITPGGAGHYVGNWTVTTPRASAKAPVTIEAAPGLAGPPVLDGNHGSNVGCSTPLCDGSVLTVPGGEYVALTGLTIADGEGNVAALNGGGLDNAGTVNVTECLFTGNTATGFSDASSDGGAIYNHGGSVTVTASTFSGNHTANGDGGAISNPYGSLTVTASTFSGNYAEGAGGAIGIAGGSVTVTASTFSGNYANNGGVGGDGGAIFNGGGTVTVTASTFSRNIAGVGGAIDNLGSLTVTASTFAANNGGALAKGDLGVRVAGDVFDGSCSQSGYGGWIDGGYNAGSDASCFSRPRAAGDVNAGSGAALKLGPLAGNGGPTRTIAPRAGSPAIDLIPASRFPLCPAADQRGYATARGARCDAGAVQTSARRPLRLKEAAIPGSFNRSGQVISYSYTVTNTGASIVTRLTLNDPAVPRVSCPMATLAPGASRTCTGIRTVSRADLAAGKITTTATATAAAANGVPVTSNTANVTVPEGWPPIVTGTRPPAPHAAAGYYLGVHGSTWTLIVTHPGSRKIVFAGTITLNAGAFRHVTRVNLEPDDYLRAAGETLTFKFTDHGDLNGVRLTTSAACTSITFTLTINGHAAATTQLYLGHARTHPRHPSPLTYTR
jgi:hypothetical protein